MGFFGSSHERRALARHRETLRFLDALLGEALCIKTELERIRMTQAELAQLLRDRAVQAEKAHTEITTRLDQLLDAIRNNPVDPSVEQAAAALGVAVQKLDDLHPDVPMPPTPENPA